MQFEEFKDMLKSGDLEQIRPHLAFEMMPADSPKTERYNDCPYIAIQDMYAIPIIWASLDDHAGSLAKKPFTRELCGYFGIGCGEAIRLVQDEVAKKALTVCELQSLVLVYKCRQKKLNSLYYKKKEQRRCSTWRKIKNRILRNSSNRSSISTMPEVPHILNWNMNMA